MTKRKTILKVFAAALLAASASQNVAAAERHPVRKTEAATSEQFRNANNSLAAAVQSGWTYRGYSAPAGH